MKGIKFVLAVLVTGVVCSAPAQLLFTNLTVSSNSNLVSGAAGNNLNAVVYNGTSNFLAVGANQVFICGNFNSNQTWFAGSNWTVGHVLSAVNGLSLDAVTIANNLFVATGDKNTVFSVTNVFAQIGGWSSNGNIFNNTAVAPGIAYNAGVFVGVSTAPEIGFTNAILTNMTFWPLATWPGQDVIESFRGVTAYGTNNGFAACGYYDDILTTTNGSSWQPISGQSTEPPLFGIASDAAGQTLAIVGAGSSGGAILISTNRAQTFPANDAYDTNFISLSSAYQLNAVAYTGSGFMAVGNSGEVLTLTNSGGTWTTNGIYFPVGASTNLNGVAFGTAGYMTGVGMLVGNSGTVILAGTPPPAATNPVGATNCADYPDAAVNGMLSVNVATDANHPAGTVSVNWYDNHANLVASGTTSFSPTNNPNLITSNAPATYTFNAVERDLRTGFTSAATPVTLQINPRPTATLTPLVTTVCNTGNSYPLTVTLAGIGPWVVYWNDGTIQTNSQAGPGPAVLTRTVSPTDPLPDSASTNIYYVTNVTSADTCIGNLPGDIIGTNIIIINPRPTASLTPVNLPTCNNGSPSILNNTLHGIGPWVVYWNDGTVQALGAPGEPGPVTLMRTVFPADEMANSVSNNLYFVTVVSNADMCEGNQPGDITGQASIIVYPNPTATLTSLVTNVCNTGNSYLLMGTLTGLGPWTVFWNDGTIQPVSGPPTFSRTVFPTNTLPNAPLTTSYFIVNVIDNAFGCPAEPGGITGIDQITVNPLPTASLTISTNDFAVSTNGTSTGLLESVSNPSGSTFDLTVGFQYLQNGTPVSAGGQTLSVTNHLSFTGIGPWTVVLADGTGNTYTNTFGGAGSYVWQETISTNNDTNFTFSVLSVQSTSTSCSGSSTNVYDVLVYGAPTALAYTTNIFCGSATNIATISAALGGFGPWTNVVWSDGFTNSLVTSSPLNRTVSTPTNSTLAQVITNYSIVSLTDTYGATTTSSNDLTGAAVVIVDPFVALPPMLPALTNYNCPNEPVVLSVAVPPNFTADWFADSGLTMNLATGTTNFTAIITNAPGTNVYYVTMRYNDLFSQTSCAPDVATNIYLVSIPCLGSITVSGGNAILFWNWNGSNVLQSTTNLLPPVMWMNVYTGALGPNFLTNDVSQPPLEFFRLYAPTN